MERYEYLESLNSEELVEIIVEMLDFEETTKAIMILEEKDLKRATELGEDIIKNNRGDDYLQATIWNVFFFDNQKLMINALEQRKEEVGKTLLDEIIIDFTNHKVNLSIDTIIRLKKTYESISKENKMDMRCQYAKFLEYYECTK